MQLSVYCVTISCLYMFHSVLTDHVLALYASYKKEGNCKRHIYTLRMKSHTFKFIKIEPKVVLFCSFVY